MSEMSSFVSNGVIRNGCNCLACFTNSQLPQQQSQPAQIAIKKEEHSVFGRGRDTSASKGWYHDPQNLISMSQYLNPAVVKVDENGNVVVPPIDASPIMYKYKTVMCKSWLLTKSCPYETRCKFAHGEEELREMAHNGVEHPKYKTKPCKNFTISGLCPFGSRCLFIHPIKESIQQMTQASHPPQRSSWPAGTNANSINLNADRAAIIIRRDCQTDYTNC